jgi:hypothetical protein
VGSEKLRVGELFWYERFVENKPNKELIYESGVKLNIMDVLWQR